jgi:hypothetical protein
MGLDMYLEGKKYLFDHKDNEQKLAKKISKLLNVKSQCKEITFQLGYWRKANQIHKWFVDNVQDGKDECEETYVTVEQLQELLDTVNKVLKDEEDRENGYSTLAEELLPTQEGFFFGGTEYDDWYYEDLKHTKEICENAIKIYNHEKEKGSWFSMYYHSSW